MKRTIMIVIVTGFAVVLLEVLATEIYFRSHEFSAREKPSWFETAVARHARNISAPSNIREMKNPRSDITKEDKAEAREHWTEHCSMCHGFDGRGDTVIGRGLYPQAPNMVEGQTQQRTDGELFYIISKGVRLTGMPSWEQEDSPDSMWDLVSFIRHLPQLTPEELKEMKELSGEEHAEEKEGQKPEEQRLEVKVSVPSLTWIRQGRNHSSTHTNTTKNIEERMIGLLPRKRRDKTLGSRAGRRLGSTTSTLRRKQ